MYLFSYAIVEVQCDQFRFNQMSVDVLNLKNQIVNSAHLDFQSEYFRGKIFCENSSVFLNSWNCTNKELGSSTRQNGCRPQAAIEVRLQLKMPITRLVHAEQSGYIACLSSVRISVLYLGQAGTRFYIHGIGVQRLDYSINVQQYNWSKFSVCTKSMCR